jgi:SAM-dependent methyltransferase
MAGMADFLTITETPGALLNAEQLGRMVLRYSLATDLGAGRRVLDASCGAGSGLGLLVDAAHTLVGSDYSTAALTLAQQASAGRIALAAADAQHLPYAAGAFDLILSFEAIYYLPRPVAFLRECRRVLDVGGRLLLSTSNPDWPYFAPGALSVRYPTAPELATWLTAAGFAAIQIFGSLPVDAAASGLGAVRAQARQRLLRIGFLRRDNRLTRALKRLSYGALTPLPAMLPASAALPTPWAELTPIAADRPDRRHRVIFAVGANSDR